MQTDPLSMTITALSACCGLLALCLVGFLGFVLIDALRQHLRMQREREAYYQDAVTYIIREAEEEWAERLKGQ